ncbi:hypothetical protein GCM10010124_12600 [Pilimelia terevasa]|uniref:Peptidase M11 gametolysin domain-containing protein n=1 Tax=Pilimelia terevasa TaxID=53372 RepID=A0A8J3BKM6_9ACTN|nr:zinc-dependent metalloprotease family protein [Pilimelia terevasa]GGK21578.1 hypothetical protein GCM10010124_12600 [Pilimelia terevasa]
MTAVRICGVVGTAVLAVLAAAPPAAAAAAEVTARGPLQVTVGDAFDGGHAREQATVRIDGADVPVPRSAVAGVPGRSLVEVTVRTGGGRTGAALAGALAAGAARVTGVRVVRAAAAAAAPGAHQITLVPMYWATAAVPAGEPTSAELAAAVGDVDAYYDEVTDGALRVNAYRTLPWTKITMPDGATCNTQTGRAQTEALRLAGTMTQSPAHHLVAYFPPAAGCGWAGLATVGAGWGSYGMIWLNSYADVRVFAHELGHNLGLHHSGGLRCTAGGLPVTQSDSCTVAAYDDPWDIMGSSPYGRVGHLSTARLAQLGVLPPAAQEYVTAGAQVRLAPVGAATGVRHVVVPVGDLTYHLEYRTPTGLDDWTDDRQYLGGGGGHGAAYPGGGLVVRRTDAALPSPEDEMYAVLDFHPLWSADVRGLGAGEFWVSADGAVGFRVDAADPTGATISVLRPQDVSAPTATVLHPSANAQLSSDFTVSWAASDAGSGIARVAVEIDGVAAAAVVRSGAAIASSLDLVDVAHGAHTLRLRVRDGAGNETLGAAVPIVVDSTPPTLTPAPLPGLARGPVTTTAVPVAVGWGVTDSGGICQQTLTRIPGVSSWPATTARSVGGTVRPGEATRWSLAAYDCRWNVNVVAGPAATATLDAQHTRDSRYSRGWTTAAGSGYVGGGEQLSRTVGAAFSYPVSTRSVGWVAAKGPTRGRAAVYVDGVKAATVDLYAARLTPRQQVFVHTWPAAGRHTVRIVNVSPAGRPLVGVDAVARLS